MWSSWATDPRIWFVQAHAAGRLPMALVGDVPRSPLRSRKVHHEKIGRTTEDIVNPVLTIVNPLLTIVNHSLIMGYLWLTMAFKNHYITLMGFQRSWWPNKRLGYPRVILGYNQAFSRRFQGLETTGTTRIATRPRGCFLTIHFSHG